MLFLINEFVDLHADSEMLMKKRIENRVGKKSPITSTDFVSVFFFIIHIDIIDVIIRKILHEDNLQFFPQNVF